LSTLVDLVDTSGSEGERSSSLRELRDYTISTGKWWRVEVLASRNILRLVDVRYLAIPYRFLVGRFERSSCNIDFPFPAIVGDEVQTLIWSQQSSSASPISSTGLACRDDTEEPFSEVN